MKKQVLTLIFGLLCVCFMHAQDTVVEGRVTDALTTDAIPDVLIKIEGASITTTTDASGNFSLVNDIPVGEQVLVVSKNGYVPKRYPITINLGGTLTIDGITLEEFEDDLDDFIISLSNDELDEDTSIASNTSGLLQSSRDVFVRTAAFDFSATFFRQRGLDSENGEMLLNGIKMNKMFNGRPQWNNWGGINDVTRNQVLANGTKPSEYSFGGISGTTNIILRASEYREGGRVSYASSDRSYTSRVIGTYSSGLMENGWAFTVSAGRRWGNEGFQQGTVYDANSFFAAVEKKINDKHSLNLVSIYTPNRRGRSSANTQEVFDLKGIEYNSFWGWYDGEKRNSRVREVEEPIVMLNHFWDINDKTTLNTNVAYQFGKIGSSRLNNANGPNPDPSYYQYLPSYFLSLDDIDYQDVFNAQQNFTNDGQINWNGLYDANLTSGEAVYTVFEDRTDDQQLSASSLFATEINDNITLNAGANFRRLKSENYAKMLDLLGADDFLDVDVFSDFGTDASQSDLMNPNRRVREGERFRYNFNLDAQEIGGFAQAQFNYNKFDFYIGASVSSTSYQREGLYDNGNFPTFYTNGLGQYTDASGNVLAAGQSPVELPGVADGSISYSFGDSEKVDFTGYGGKAGFTYKISGKHLVDVNGAYVSRAPTLRNTFSNSRQNNDIVDGIQNELITAADVSYIFRSPIVNARLTGYYNKTQDATEISFFFADGISLNSGNVDNTNDANGSAFVQEVLSGLDRRSMGLEFGAEVQVTPTVKIRGAAAIGENVYANNPNIYLTSDDFVGQLDLGVSNLKDYKIAGGPQNAASLGFEYRDPKFWWFGVSGNYFSNAYIDVSPITRTSNFYLDQDGLLINGYDPAVARQLLVQEQIDDYFLVNLVGGKSWKIGDYFLGFFASISNVLSEEYKTGGFEQSRNANYTELLEDRSLDKPVFGSRYWYGRTSTYFVNVYFRF
ncbi:MAG: TonB-dependent receptor [Flavobacteriaceae bacterium]|nr:TonB-dependent receptor [Flavobacteriaceae bacterium]